MKDEKAELANEIVKNHMLYSFGAGFVPIPLLDIAAVSAVQLAMLRQLSKLYGMDFKESMGKSWISAITGSTLARMGASLVKSVPGIGSILGGVTMSALSGASTYAVGQVFIRHFQTGGDFFNFDLSKGKEVYKEEFEKGKEIAKDLEKKQTDTGHYEDPLERIEKLAALRDKGIISEQEFQEQKTKLLSSL